MTQALNERGFDVLEAPVLRIEASQTRAPGGCFDLAVYVSENAVAHAVKHPRGPWQGTPAVAIGGAAAAAMQAAGIRSAVAWQADAGRVVQALAAMPSPPQRTLIVKGAGGRDIVQRWLRGRGLDAVEWNVYRRAPTAPQVGGERIDAIVAASGDGLRVVGKLWFAQQRDRDVVLLVPSERVAAIAATLGFENVFVTHGASAGAVLVALEKLRDAGRHG